MGAPKGRKYVTKRAAALSILAVFGGLSMAVAQQAPTENKGMRRKRFWLHAWQQGLDDLAQRQMRIRQITIEPGGVAGLYAKRPSCAELHNEG